MVAGSKSKSLPAREGIVLLCAGFVTGLALLVIGVLYMAPDHIAMSITEMIGGSALAFFSIR